MMSDNKSSHQCASCGKAFDTQKKLQGHINSGQTDCTWNAPEAVDGADLQDSNES